MMRPGATIAVGDGSTLPETSCQQRSLGAQPGRQSRRHKDQARRGQYRHIAEIAEVEDRLRQREQRKQRHDQQIAIAEAVGNRDDGRRRGADEQGGRGDHVAREHEIRPCKEALLLPDVAEKAIAQIGVTARHRGRPGIAETEPASNTTVAMAGSAMVNARTRGDVTQRPMPAAATNDAPAKNQRQQMRRRIGVAGDPAVAVGRDDDRVGKHCRHGKRGAERSQPQAARFVASDELDRMDRHHEGEEQRELGAGRQGQCDDRSADHRGAGAAHQRQRDRRQQEDDLHIVIVDAAGRELEQGAHRRNQREEEGRLRPLETQPGHDPAKRREGRQEQQQRNREDGVAKRRAAAGEWRKQPRRRRIGQVQNARPMRREGLGLQHAGDRPVEP